MRRKERERGAALERACLGKRGSSPQKRGRTAHLLACKDGRGSEGACVAGLVQKWSKVACGSILAQGKAWFGTGQGLVRPTARLTTGPERRRRVGSSRGAGLAREKQDWHLARESNACGSARKACKGTGGLSPWANAMVTAAALLAGPRRRGTRSRKREQLGRSGRAYATHPRVTCMGCSMEGLLA